MKKLIIGFLVINLFTMQLKAQWKCGDTLTDSRDGQKYPTIQIGNQCWMAKNLNTGVMVQAGTNVNAQSNNSTIEKYCYQNITSNCDTFGGLYMWNEMMGYVQTQGIQGICPQGWHLPAVAEWDTLFSGYDSTTVAIQLQTGGNSGFNAPAAGYCYHNYQNWVFGSIHVYGVYRTTQPSTSMGADYSTVFYYYPGDGKIYKSTSYKKTSGYSVRCVWNGSSEGINNPESPAFEIPEPYPNPATASITIPFNLKTNDDLGIINIYNSTGQLIKTIEVYGSGTSVSIDLQGFASGIYYYYLISDQTNSIVRKFEVR